MKVSFHISTRLSKEHNERTRNEWNSDGHINKDMSGKNVTLYECDWKQAYVEIFGEALQKFNEKQIANRHEERVIDDYFKHCMKSDKLNQAYECVIQIGDHENAPRDPYTLEYFYSKLLEHWRDENPNFVILGAYLHLDEATPHLHLDYVPVARDCTRGMEVQNSQSKALEQMGFKSSGKYSDLAISRWTEKERCRIEELASQLFEGIEEHEHHSKSECLKHKEYYEHEMSVVEKRLEELKAKEQELSLQFKDHIRANSVIEYMELTDRDLEDALMSPDGKITVSAYKLSTLNEAVKPSYSPEIDLLERMLRER